MSLIGRIRTAFGRTPARAREIEIPPEVAEFDALAKGGLRGGNRVAIGLRYALSQGTPGSWTSDHREETNHFTGWNYIAIHAAAQQAAQADVSVYVDDGQDKAPLRKAIHRRGLSKAYAEQATESETLPQGHPFMRLLKRPNPTQSGASFRYECIVQLRLTGTILIWMVRNSLGRTLERYVIPIAATTPVEPSADLPRGGWRVNPSIWRLTTTSDPQGFTEIGSLRYAVNGVIPAEDMLVIRRPHPLWKDDGYSPLAAGAMIIDTAEQIDEARWNGMRNGADPSIHIAGPVGWDPPQEELDATQEALQQKYAGPNRAKKVMLTVNGSTVTPLTTNPKDMDYVQAFTQYREAVMAFQGTPGIAAGFFPPNGTYGALAATIRVWGHLTIQPDLDLLAEEETEQQSPEFGTGLTVEYLHTSVDDPELLEKQLATDISAGAITKGEVRALRGRAPFGDERDDETAGPQLPPVAAGDPNAEEKPDGKSADPFAKSMNGNGHTNGHAHRNGNGTTRRAAVLAAMEAEDEYP